MHTGHTFFQMSSLHKVIHLEVHIILQFSFPALVFIFLFVIMFFIFTARPHCRYRLSSSLKPIFLQSVGVLRSRNVPNQIWLHGPTSSLSWTTSKLDCTPPDLASISTTSRSLSLSHISLTYFSVFSSHVCVIAPIRCDLPVSYWIVLNYATKERGDTADVSFATYQNYKEQSISPLHSLLFPHTLWIPVKSLILVGLGTMSV